MTEHICIHYHPIMSKEELHAANMYFPVTPYVRDIPEYSLVIPRYTLQEPVKDIYMEEINRRNLKSINSIQASLYFHNIRLWYSGVDRFTPKTWFQENFPTFLRHESGSFVVKGLCKSRKDNWKELMFASSPREAFDRVVRIQQDGPEACIRRYVPLKTCGEGINGIPITREYRCFILKGKIQYVQYYWTNNLDAVPEEWLNEPKEPKFRQFLDSVLEELGMDDWFVLDIAQTENGNWILIEVNDAQQSGIPILEEKDYKTFYKNLWSLV